MKFESNNILEHPVSNTERQFFSPEKLQNSEKFKIPDIGEFCSYTNDFFWLTCYSMEIRISKINSTTVKTYKFKKFNPSIYIKKVML